MSQAGQKLRELRKERKLTLAQVSAQVGVDIAILSKIERGERKITKAIVEKLATLYEVKAEPLIVSALNEQLLQQYGQDELGQQAIMAAEQQVAYGKPASTTKQTRYKPPIDEITEFFKKQQLVSRAWLFGSMARQDYTENSDVDILIEVPETTVFTLFDLAEVQEQLEKITNKKVDVVMLGGLRPLMKEYVERDRLLIYES